MSSSEAHAFGVAVAKQPWLRATLCTLLLGAALAACGSEAGFRPLYAPSASGIGLDQTMAQIQIAPVPSRVGQRIRNELIFQHTGGGAPPPPLYTLEIAITESVTSTLVQTNGEALSQIYNLNASFRLVSIKDKRVVLTGNSHARAGFERFTSIYSNVRAREDAENRAAKTLAEELKGRLAAHLSGGRT
jgi:LPS-assembly lipoprotein